MADNLTRIVLSAVDQASATIGKVGQSLGTLGSQSDALSGMLNKLTGAVTVGAFVGFTKGAIDAADSMNDLSQSVGIGMKELAGWQLAANQSGTSIESVAKGVKSLSKYMVENGDALRAAGITATDADGAMIQLADLFAEMPDGIEKTTLATQLFGKAGVDMIAMLNQGSAGLEDTKKKAEEYAQRLAEIAPDADKFNDLVAELGLQSKLAGMNIAGYFLPGLIGLSQWLNDVAAGGLKAREAIKWISGGLIDNTGGAIGYTGQRDALGLPLAPGSAPAAGPAAKTGTGRGLLARGGSGGGGKAGGLKTKDFDPVEDYFFAIGEAQRKQQRASFDERDREAAKEAEQIDKLYDKYIKLGTAVEKVDDFSRDMGMSFSSAFEDAIIGGQKLGNVLNALGMDIARIFLRKTITEPLGSSVADMAKGINWSGIFSPGFGDTAGLAAGVPQYAQGTPWVPNDGLAYLHKGEAVIPASQNAGGGVTVNIVEDPNRAGQTQQRQDSSGATMLDVFVDRIRAAVASDISRGSGPIPQAMSNTYGLNRAAGAF